MIALLYIPIAILRAWIDAKRIKGGKRIYHGINGAITLACAALVFWLADWKVALSLLFITRVFFDVSLNLFRGLGIDYISPEVVRYISLKEAFRKGKVADYIEYRLFKNNGYAPKILYLLIIVILLTV